MNSIKLDNFKFFRDLPWDDKKVFRILIPSSINTTADLHKFYASLLQIGGYYGHNWDALDEVIKDLEWIEKKEIEILHDGLPELPSGELKIYLSILSDAVDFWNDKGINAEYLTQRKIKHTVDIYFPNECKEKINNLKK